MKPIGIKTLILVFLFLVVDSYLISRQYEVQFVVAQLRADLAMFFGAFATLMSGLVYRSFKLREPSRVGLSLILPEREVYGEPLFTYKGYGLSMVRSEDIETPFFDIRPSLKKLLVFLTFAGLGIGFFQFRQLGLLKEVPNKTYFGKTHYCPQETTAIEEKQLRPECRLVYRAFQLGYAKDLGTCGKKEEDKPVLCTLRQHDEPFLHYAYRKFADLWGQSVNIASTLSIEQIKEKLRSDAQRFQALVADRLSELGDAPEALHILLVSAKDPGNQPWVKRNCMQEFQRLTNELPPSAETGRAVKHAFGHLLFDQGYARPSARCEEFKVIWDVPAETCSKVIRQPKEVLAQLDLMPEIQRVIKRYQIKAKAHPNSQFHREDFFISLNCLGSEDSVKTTRLQTSKVKFDQFELPIRSLTISAASIEKPLSVDIFKNTARLFAPSFRYGELQSRSSLNLGQTAPITQDLLNPVDFPHTRLAFLRDIDVFLSDSWVEQDAEIMSIYPYHLHLNQFVNRFREKYHEHRGRMK